MYNIIIIIYQYALNTNNNNKNIFKYVFFLVFTFNQYMYICNFQFLNDNLVYKAAQLHVCTFKEKNRCRIRYNVFLMIEFGVDSGFNVCLLTCLSNLQYDSIFLFALWVFNLSTFKNYIFAIVCIKLFMFSFSSIFVHVFETNE